MAVLPILLAVLFGMFAVAERRHTGNCFLNGHCYDRGAVITLPGDSKCIRRECHYATFNTISEGCEFEGRCMKVGENHTTYDCVTRTCTKTRKNDKFVYSAGVTRTLCPDVYGDCHEHGTEGLVILDHKFNVVEDCTCNIRSDGHVYHDCSNTGYRYS